MSLAQTANGGVFEYDDYSYDSNGNRQGEVISDGQHGALSSRAFGYDVADRLSWHYYRRRVA